jgi:hypothetical protein
LDAAGSTIGRIDIRDIHPRLACSACARHSPSPRWRSPHPLDDPATFLAAQVDPAGFVLDLEGPVTIDATQRVPELFLAIKQSVDRDRRPVFVYGVGIHSDRAAIVWEL